MIHAGVRAVLANGVITEAERAHLVETLQQLIGGTPQQLAETGHISELALDGVQAVKFAGSVFVVTENCAYGPRESCVATIEKYGGINSSGVTRKVRYVVVRREPRIKR